MDIVNLIIGLAALGLSLWALFFGSPKRVTVDVNKDVNITVGVGARDAARIIVTNHGSSAVSIRSIGLMALDGSGAVDYERSKTDNAVLPEGPDLPAKVEPNGTLIWRYSDEILRPLGSQTDAVAYITIPRTLKNPQPREIRSERVITIS